MGNVTEMEVDGVEIGKVVRRGNGSERLVWSFVALRRFTAHGQNRILTCEHVAVGIESSSWCKVCGAGREVRV